MDMLGQGMGIGYNVQFPYDARKDEVGDEEYIYACQNVFFPILKKFQPDMIIVSAGFDSAEGDPVGGAYVTPYGFAWMTYGLRQI